MYLLKWLCLSVAAISLAGCGPAGPEKVGASGEVKYNGTPVQDGEISFSPEVGTNAPPTSAPIINGKYELQAKWALSPGTYSVAIRSYKVDAAKQALVGTTPDKPVGIVIKEQLLPPKFNDKSTIDKLTVKSGQKSVKQDYDLKD